MTDREEMKPTLSMRIVIGLAVALLLAAGGILLRSGEPVQPAALSTPSASTSETSTTERPTGQLPDGEPGGNPLEVNSRDSIEEHNRTARSMGDFFDGTIAGVKVDRHHTLGCDNERPMTESEQRRYSLPVPKDLPSGWKVKEAEGWMCGDRPRAVDRVVEFDAFIALGIARFYNEDTLDARAGEKLVSKGTIQGRPAVLIKPMSRQGSGNSWIAFKDGDDLIAFIGVDIRFEILRRAAESFPL